MSLNGKKLLNFNGEFMMCTICKKHSSTGAWGLPYVQSNWLKQETLINIL